MGDALPDLIVDEILEAGRTFPSDTGLDWNQWHPRVVKRLARSTLFLLVAILIECERAGKWPAGIGIVLTALLPKPDGGYRPIGLLPTESRLWMRARRNAARRREEVNARDWLYVEKAKVRT